MKREDFEAAQKINYQIEKIDNALKNWAWISELAKVELDEFLEKKQAEENGIIYWKKSRNYMEIRSRPGIWSSSGEQPCEQPIDNCYTLQTSAEMTMFIAAGKACINQLECERADLEAQLAAIGEDVA